jgi:integrase
VADLSHGGLTGLRWGEGAGLRWPDVSDRGGWVEPTKTGTSWTIPLRAPLSDLLRRQRALY